MNGTTALIVLGKENLEVFENQLNNLRGINSEIKSAINSHQNACQFIVAETFNLVRLRGISEVLKNIKVKIDLTYKALDHTNEMLLTRSYIINVFSNIDEIVNAINNRNDALLRKYSNELDKLISEYC